MQQAAVTSGVHVEGTGGRTWGDRGLLGPLQDPSPGLRARQQSGGMLKPGHGRPHLPVPTLRDPLPTTLLSHRPPQPRHSAPMAPSCPPPSLSPQTQLHPSASPDSSDAPASSGHSLPAAWPKAVCPQRQMPPPHFPNFSKRTIFYILQGCLSSTY